MSYCRWSSDAFQCDLYVYDHYLGGLSINVATRRRKPIDPINNPPPDYDCTDAFTLRDSLKKQKEWLNNEDNWEWYTLPNKWRGFSALVPYDEGIRILKQIKEHGGYNMPDTLIQEVEHELQRQMAETQCIDTGSNSNDTQDNEER